MNWRSQNACAKSGAGCVRARAQTQLVSLEQPRGFVSRTALMQHSLGDATGRQQHSQQQLARSRSVANGPQTVTGQPIEQTAFMFLTESHVKHSINMTCANLNRHLQLIGKQQVPCGFHWRLLGLKIERPKYRPIELRIRPASGSIYLLWNQVLMAGSIRISPCICSWTSPTSNRWSSCFGNSCAV